MNNKEKLQEQAEKLQLELDKLKLQISKSDEEDIFSCKTYTEVSKRLNKDKENCPYKVIKDIEKYFNQGWKPNWKNTKEHKYYPYFSSGSYGGLVFYISSCFISDFSGGVSFYKTKEISDFVGRTFIKEYKNLRDN